MEAKRKVCVVLVDRANYGRLKPVMEAIQFHPDLELQVVAAGTMVLERFGMPVDVLRADGLPVDSEIYMELEGSTPTSMAKSVGFGIVEFANEFRRLMPDLILLIGDRYEALSAAIAAAYMNQCLVHLQGGEVSGSIDESARHAISKFAQFHIPSTERSKEYLIRMGEQPESILAVGCPSSDLAASFDRNLTAEVLNGKGNGAWLDPEQPFLLVVFHPTTTSYGSEYHEVQEVLRALGDLKKPTLLLWPNIDAGSNKISKEIRIFRDHAGPDWLRTIINCTPEDYLRILANTSCAVGNSSSFVRDAGYFGTPVVLAGDRQDGREFGRHVFPRPTEAHSLASAIRAQLEHGRYPPCSLYGDGQVSKKTADALATLTPYVQKRLSYVSESLQPAAGAIAPASEEVSAILASGSSDGRASSGIAGRAASR